MAAGVAPPASLLAQWACRCYFPLPSHHSKNIILFIFCKVVYYFFSFVLTFSPIENFEKFII